MTPNEQLHALLQAFNDSVKKLVQGAVEAERAELKLEREKSAQMIKQIEWAKEHMPSEMKAWAILEQAIAEYESQSK